MSFMRFMLILFIALLLSISGSFGYLVFTIAGMDTLSAPAYALTTRIYDINDNPVALRYVENRVEVPLNEISEHLVLATIAAEDRRYYQHFGFDLPGMGRALVNNVKKLQTTQGGSTITQQLAKNLFLSHERTVERKVKEAVYTIHLERNYSKEEILTKYLNTIYYGHSAYGIEAAAQTYFGKSAYSLTLAEASLLAGIPRGPQYYSPFINESAAMQRQKVVLGQMLTAGLISETERDAAVAEELHFRDTTREEKYQYFLDHMINMELLRHFDGDHFKIYGGGLEIYTTLDPEMQQLAQKTIADIPQLRTDQEEKRQPQGALVAIEPETGYIRALVGGRDYNETKLNRALSLRSPGSSFKPFLYAAALECGHTVFDAISCGPISLSEPGLTQPYEPTDFGGGFHNRDLTIREALVKSCNIVAITTHVDIGREKAVEMASRLGINSPMNPYLSLPLGTIEVTLLELTAAFAPFANGGYRVEPVLIRKVMDSQGNTLLENLPQAEKVLDEGIAFLITDMLKGVLQEGGTASRAASILSRPAAGKSGTSQDSKNAHMVGYTPQLVVGLYIGDDDETPLGATGGRLAAPLWAEFMEQAHQGWTAREFPVPENIIRVSLCPESGLLRDPLCSSPELEEFFIVGTEPTEYCTDENCRPTLWWPWLTWQRQLP